MKPRVLHVVSEIAPWVKTGGLADVAGALPAALRDIGYDARVVVPGYPAILDALRDRRVVGSDPDLFEGGQADLLAGTLGEIPAFVVDAPAHFAREGIYVDAEGREHVDNPRRFAALGWAAAAVVNAFRIGEQASVLHLHDWQAGMAAAYVRYGPRPDTPILTTIHNLAYQGRFDSDVFAELGLPKQASSIYGVEYYGGVGFLKAGLYYADVITTVSPTYAQEIQTPEKGHGLEGLLRSRASRLFGVLNGIDVEVWNPSTDPALPSGFDEGSIDEGKRAVREALGGRFDVATDGPWFGVVSRLTWAKGIDVVLDRLAALPSDACVVVLGSGDVELERRISEIAANDARVVAHLGYDEQLAHRIIAASDFLFVPSRDEPCGLTQMYAMRYGTVPIARAVGGLADTVREGESGIAFTTDESIADAVARALALRDSDAWDDTRRRLMRIDHSWTASAKRYAEIYDSLVR